MNQRAKANFVAKVTSTKVQLPEGYEVENEGFQKFAVYCKGQFVRHCSQLVYAYNFAQRHARGESL